MSSNEQRYNVLPSRMSLSILKNKIKSASSGHKMLKSKRDALNHHNMGIVRSLKDTKLELVRTAKEAFFALSAAKVTTDGQFAFAIQDRIEEAQGGVSQNSGVASGQPAAIVCERIDTVAGVSLPRLSRSVPDASDGQPSHPRAGHVGLGRGGEQVHSASESFGALLDASIAATEGQIAFQLVNTEYKKTNRRVNALEKVVLPRLTATLSYVQSELEETEKEEFFRLKMVQKKKKAVGQ